MIYLDNSATTKPYKEVLTTVQTVADDYFANPSSLHALGGRSEALMAEARRQAAALIGTLPQDVVFTSGGTESNNLAIKGTAFAHRRRGKHMITTVIEHASVLRAFEQLESLGFEVTYLTPHADGRITFDDFLKAYREDTLLVSVMHVNNETGAVQPVLQIGEFLKQQPRTVFHVDHVQGFTKVPLRLADSGIDLCTISGHKIHGPKGTGLLYVRQGVLLSPLFAGGGQESGYRSGTENLPGICGLVKAMRLTKEREAAGVAHLKTLQQRLVAALPAIGGTVHTCSDNAAPHIVNVSFKGLRSEVLVHALEEKDIFVSTKSACASKESEASAVLLAMGVPEEEASAAIRISMAYETTVEEIDRFLTILKESVASLTLAAR
ncbi:MAG: cysteine desulfurase family protein [Sporolactobacillus sp.]